MYGLTELGGLIAGESLVVIGPGPRGLLGVALVKALGAGPVILIGTRESRLEIGRQLGADFTLNVKNEKDIVQSVKKIVEEKGSDYVIECAGTKEALNNAILMTNRGGKICRSALPHKPVEINIPHTYGYKLYLYVWNKR